MQFENEADLGFEERALPEVLFSKEEISVEKKVALQVCLEKAARLHADGLIKMVFRASLAKDDKLNLGNVLCEGVAVQLGEYE